MFGQNLKKLRTSKNLSQSKLSKILGISSSTIGMYEQGRRFPDQTILTKIADFFDVSTVTCLVVIHKILQQSLIMPLMLWNSF